jgi:Family of unknown function (DUF5681)
MPWPKSTPTQWVKGQSGNPGGKRARDEFRAALMRQVHACRGDTPKLNLIAAKLVNMAIDGDLNAIKEVADRIDGKVPTPLAEAIGDQPSVLVVNWGKRTETIENDNDIPLLELKSANVGND